MELFPYYHYYVDYPQAARADGNGCGSGFVFGLRGTKDLSLFFLLDDLESILRSE